jgi:putative flippase GtrA
MTAPMRRRGLVATGAGFVISGIIALTIDMGVLSLLTRVVGVSALLARPVGISIAMVGGWLAHRHFTFAVQEPPSVAEFGRYAAMAWGVAAVNYGVFTLGLWLFPKLPPEVVLVGASLVAMTASFLGMRYGVFRRGSGHPP